MLKQFISLIVLLLLSSSAFAQDTLRVMSYNIYHGEQAYNRGESNLKDIAKFIKEVDPDFVALQEVDSLTQRSGKTNNGVPENQIQTLAELTNMHGYFGKAIPYDGGGYGEGILSKEPHSYRKLMLPIPEGGEGRTVLILEAQTRSGDPFIFAGTHLCHQFSENRLAQVKKINDYFGKNDNPIIMGGDFNFPPDLKPYDTIRSNWKDIASLSNNNDATISYESPTHRIDYLFLLKGSKWEILNYEVRKVGYSDHMPVIAEIVIHNN